MHMQQEVRDAVTSRNHMSEDRVALFIFFCLVICRSYHISHL